MQAPNSRSKNSVMNSFEISNGAIKPGNLTRVSFSSSLAEHY